MYNIPSWTPPNQVGNCAETLSKIGLRRKIGGMADQENKPQKRPQGKKKSTGKKAQQTKKTPAQQAPGPQGGSGGSTQNQVLRVIDTNAVPHETGRPDTPVSEADRPHAERKGLDKENDGVVSFPLQSDGIDSWLTEPLRPRRGYTAHPFARDPSSRKYRLLRRRRGLRSQPGERQMHRVGTHRQK